MCLKLTRVDAVPTDVRDQVADEWFPKWDALIVPGSKKKGEVWTEVEKLRVVLGK